ncbi:MULTISPECIES: protein translocase subunit SecF [unclassified Leptolyngbya]|jgi:preprotein translocase subunit SecF|uniref:protein translocase subunit SecF n=1 Tax=unclassified Leptolyngbya TaxID=2650499 RepID=UPI001681E1C5|nr:MULTISPECIES: protein translocase subunit SecF [unclassified Leptolyngbya]MBD1912011.1 protein translocase subunit SecF [Leptolyngbya sp. FACHB-8]MBD2155381.1 protein translocase subunit SecF [Leptolyngbya sp. FACHB-16]
MKLNVIKQRKLWWGISTAIILAGLVAMVISWKQIGAPLRPSLDFVGGTRLQLELACAQSNSCDGPIDPGVVREILATEGLEGSSIQVVGDRQEALSIRTSTLEVEEREQLLQALAAKLGEFDPASTQIDTVGPTLGRQTFTSGLVALGLSFLGIMVYLTFRFQPDYAVFAIVALLHDVLITVGIFAILGLALQVEVDSLFIVSLLTIVGFSVNDTVVIYDRVRETIKINPNRHIDEVVDDAVNQTLTRSINTTLTTLLSLVAIFLFGGDTLKYFALALIIGFVAGAYSSIFIASTLLALWRERTGNAYAQVSPVEAEPADSAS